MRLIDADKIEPHWIIRSDGTRVYAVHYEDIERAQPLEVVPEVLCKECRYWLGPMNEYGRCWKWQNVSKEDEYCSRAEKKDGDK